MPRGRRVALAPAPVRIGTAGWSLPRILQDRFDGDGAHLARYARVFDAAEINSSFHRPHRPATYERWAASVPASFRFSVKIPKTVTHERKLVDADALLERFLDEAAGLGATLGCLLVQLPPSLALEADIAQRFFATLRARWTGDVAVEPRHASWFDAAGDALLREFRLARVGADPARVPAAARPAGDSSVAYWRWHGSPRMYWSSYDDAVLAALADDVRAARAAGSRVWCIFDNTTSGAATANALALRGLIERDA